MQIVIEIPTEQYEILCKQKDRPCRLLIEKAITDGIILPKGHGDLIDKNNIIGDIHGVRSITAVLNAPIIIPADKGDAE